MRIGRPRAIALPKGLRLTPEEGFVLSRIDGRLSIEALATLTGIDASIVDEIVSKLVQEGAVELDGESALSESPDTPPESELVDIDDEAIDDEGANYRAVYERQFSSLSVNERVDLAHKVHGSELLALCLDHEARVVAAIVENATAGLAHARLIAFHHRTSTGLELLSRRKELVRDALVERRLLRNPQAGEHVVSRILTPKRLLPTYKVALDRDIPELARVRARTLLRQKFGTAPSEERADLVVRTEGRCLPLMTGCTFDARATSILCGRSYHSTLFVQNLARFSATPPMLLAHLMKQPFVRKSVPLKRMLLQHPNMPSDIKRQG
jgi:hypothetical protein